MQETLVEEYGQEFFDKHWKIWMEIMMRIYTKNSGEFCYKDLHKITCPTFVLHGKKDMIVLPKHAHYLHKHIKNSK